MQNYFEGFETIFKVRKIKKEKVLADSRIILSHPSKHILLVEKIK